MGLFEFVVGECICWWHHNTNPGYQVQPFFSRRISQADCSIHIKLNYWKIEEIYYIYLSTPYVFCTLSLLNGNNEPSSSTICDTISSKVENLSPLEFTSNRSLKLVCSKNPESRWARWWLLIVLALTSLQNKLKSTGCGSLLSSSSSTSVWLSAT